MGYLQAVRYGDFKVNLLGQFSVEERQNVLNSTYKHPEIMKEIMEMAEKEKRALGEYTNQGHAVGKTIFA